MSQPAMNLANSDGHCPRPRYLAPAWAGVALALIGLAPAATGRGQGVTPEMAIRASAKVRRQFT